MFVDDILVANNEVTVSFVAVKFVATTVPIVAVAEPALTVVNARELALAPVANSEVIV